MPLEITAIFGPEARLNHVDQVALAGSLPRGTFDTKDFGRVTVERGSEATEGTFLARSRDFNVTVIVDRQGDQSAITMYDGLGIVGIDTPQELADLREQVDRMLQQCNNVTRR